VSGWLIFAPTRADDQALANSAAVAERHRGIVPGSSLVIVGPAATRDALEDALTVVPSPTGLAFFGHGNTNRLLDANYMHGVDPPSCALDFRNVYRARGMWVHAFACLSAVELARRAVEDGVELYAGYRRPVNVSWTEPAPAEPQFCRLVTALTQALVEGERDPTRLRATVSAAADTFLEALMAADAVEPEPCFMALNILVQNLVDDLEILAGASPSARAEPPPTPTPPETPLP
jgi:hypothetical protein